MEQAAAILFGLLILGAMLWFAVYLVGRLYAAFRGSRMSARARWGAGLLVLATFAVADPEASLSLGIVVLYACACGGVMRLLRSPAAPAKRS